jgi:hypothetical protein
MVTFLQANGSSYRKSSMFIIIIYYHFIVNPQGRAIIGS